MSRRHIPDTTGAGADFRARFERVLTPELPSSSDECGDSSESIDSVYSSVPAEDELGDCGGVGSMFDRGGWCWMVVDKYARGYEKVS
jgi:hypothetical protein